MWLNIIPARINNNIHNKVWDDITYPVINFNGVTFEIWELISDFIPYFTVRVITYPCWWVTCWAAQWELLKLFQDVMKIPCYNRATPCYIYCQKASVKHLEKRWWHFFKQECRNTICCVSAYTRSEKCNVSTKCCVCGLGVVARSGREVVVVVVEVSRWCLFVFCTFNMRFIELSPRIKKLWVFRLYTPGKIQRTMHSYCI